MYKILNNTFQIKANNDLQCFVIQKNIHKFANRFRSEILIEN
jgi:hypothetical protein